MPEDLSRAYEALRAADAAGNTDDAQKIANYIRSQEGKAKPEALEPVAMHPAEMAAEAAGGLGGMFRAREPEEVTARQAMGAVAGGAAAGALSGAAAPGMLKAAGKVVPGVIGKALGGMGEAASMLPLKERMLRGAGGGAVSSAVGEAGRGFGAPAALTFGAEVLGGGLGESGASFLTKESGNLLGFIGNLSYGNVAGASRALKGVFQPNKQLNRETAERLQKRLFGEKVEGYVDNLVGSDNRRMVQEQLRKEDPSLLGPGPRVAEPPRAPWETSTGEMEDLGPLSMGRGVAAAGGQQPQRPMIGGPKALPGPAAGNSAAAAGASRFAAGKAGAAAKAAARKAEADEAAAANQLRPASEIYRDRMFDNVTAAVKQGKTFSSTPEFAAFKEKLDTLATLGDISNSEKQKLLQTLMADRLKDGMVLDRYAQTVDNRIREWGKPAEAGGQAGYAAVTAQTAGEVRQALREAYNGYLERLGLGKLEQQYRQAYSREMVAEAKDKLPHFLQGFGTAEEFRKMARGLARDPAGREFVQASLTRHMAQQEPREVVREFERLQKVLVDAKLLQPSDLKRLREGAQAVKEAADAGLKVKRGQRFAQILAATMVREGGAAAGRGLAAGGEGQE